MVTQTAAEARVPLTRERIFTAAVDLADRDGIEAVTMRRLAEEVGVEAMSLYHHVANKEALLDGMIDMVAGEINATVATVTPPGDADDWKRAMRARILGARTVLLKHRWARSVVETRTDISPQLLRYFDSVLGIFVAGGFSYDTAHHALHALGSRALGFTQELFEPEDASTDDAEAMEAMAAMAEELPHLIGMLSVITHDPDLDTNIGWCDDQTEFEFGLDLILDGLDRLRAVN